MAGRKPLPANVHLLRGNPSHKSQAELGAASLPLPVEVPACPAFLGHLARAEWRRIAPLLKTAGLVTAIDRGVLAMYCQAYGEWALLEQRVKEKLLAMTAGGSDPLVETTPSGYRQVSALAQARDRAADRMLRAAKEFGMSPATRINGLAPFQPQLPGMPGDPMEAFLQAGAPPVGGG